MPSTESEWKYIAQQFEDKWNFPHCIGALDGKHVMIRPPPNSGSFFFNYKHHFSMVLLALVDADYKFIYLDIGCNGRVSDGGVLRNSSLSTALKENTLNIPGPSVLPGVSVQAPFFIVADDAFPLKTCILKPYAQTGLTKQRRIYNYRLSRARRIVENAFGILSNRFRIFMQPIALSPEKIEHIILACCSLHNFLRVRLGNCSVYTPNGIVDTETDTHEVIDGRWRQDPQPQGLQPLSEQQGGNRYTNDAKGLRNYMCDYFNSDAGSVPWQENMI